jgi:hypothetical protein
VEDSRGPTRRVTSAPFAHATFPVASRTARTNPTSTAPRSDAS